MARDYQGQMESEFLQELSGATGGRPRGGRGARRRRQVQQAQEAVEFTPDAAAEAERRRAQRVHQQQYEQQLYGTSATGGSAAASTMDSMLPTSLDEMARLFVLAEVFGKPPPGLDDDW